jgi:hypothetical protein
MSEQPLTVLGTGADASSQPLGEEDEVVPSVQ